MRKQSVPEPIKRAINQTAHFLSQHQFGRLGQQLLADAMELLYSDTPVDEIVQAVRKKSFAKARHECSDASLRES